MKNTAKYVGRISVLGLMLATANLGLAQISETTTTTTTSSAGTIGSFSPGTFTVRTESSPAPIRYTTTKTTTYVDESGNPVSVETVKSGLPVTVYYDQEGDRTVATKVVLKKSVTTASPVTTRQQTLTATTSGGLVSQFTPDALVVKTDAVSSPVSYSFTKTTTYVDENGNPVSVETVKSGVPVTVYYDKDGDHMVASKVVVRTSQSVQPDGSTIEQKTTTTTSTSTTPEDQ